VAASSSAVRRARRARPRLDADGPACCARTHDGPPSRARPTFHRDEVPAAFAQCLIAAGRRATGRGRGRSRAAARQPDGALRGAAARIAATAGGVRTAGPPASAGPRGIAGGWDVNWRGTPLPLRARGPRRPASSAAVCGTGPGCSAPRPIFQFRQGRDSPSSGMGPAAVQARGRGESRQPPRTSQCQAAQPTRFGGRGLSGLDPRDLRQPALITKRGASPDPRRRRRVPRGRRAARKPIHMEGERSQDQQVRGPQPKVWQARLALLAKGLEGNLPAGSFADGGRCLERRRRNDPTDHAPSTPAATAAKPRPPSPPRPGRRSRPSRPRPACRASRSTSPAATSSPAVGVDGRGDRGFLPHTTKPGDEQGEPPGQAAPPRRKTPVAASLRVSPRMQARDGKKTAGPRREAPGPGRPPPTPLQELEQHDRPEQDRGHQEDRPANPGGGARARGGGRGVCQGEAHYRAARRGPPPRSRSAKAPPFVGGPDFALRTARARADPRTARPPDDFASGLRHPGGGGCHWRKTSLTRPDGYGPVRLLMRLSVSR